jgi:outer membrane protein assembly factor BamA
MAYSEGSSFKKTPKGFYRYSRQMVKIKADLTGEITDNLYWEAGYNFNWLDISSFTPEGYTVLGDRIPGGTTLFDLYKTWGIVPLDQADGGIVSSIRLGLMYDTRNVENNPTKGIWAEAHLDIAPKFLGTTHQHFTLSANMRQYLPIADNLTFAYRVAYQGLLNDDAPWYMMPFYTSMGPKQDFDGVGGYRTARGLMLNRVVGKHTAFYNAEMRWRFVNFQKWNQNIAFALTGFCDGAYTIKGYDIETKTPLNADLYSQLIDTSKKDGIHAAAGAGLRFIMNQNFIVAFEYAKCFNPQDGNGAFYINTGFLF